MWNTIGRCSIQAVHMAKVCRPPVRCDVMFRFEHVRKMELLTLKRSISPHLYHSAVGNIGNRKNHTYVRLLRLRSQKCLETRKEGLAHSDIVCSQCLVRGIGIGADYR
ncbi:RLORF9 [Gallid alphaherpesvirus 2]|uniref:RLORF9 n=3 Tax=Alphaherpesvirinae TaxID=10293 RepID=G9CUI1_9ALPH|nr:ORF2 [Gallid alphaherpesvirus 1]AAF66800.1 R-LORF9 [Gallid alphaherpesvirus 2]ACF49531.1 RLORF9 [synthetic construct]AEV54969.1 RLORF9 [Gallid herpesvirus 2 strain 814]AAA20962.1 ORF2 [Gallid alphaherpesvirus 1]